MLSGIQRFTRSTAFDSNPQVQNMDMEMKTGAQRPSVEDVEDQDLQSVSSEDKQVMAQMGKKQQLKVGIALFTISLPSCAIVGCKE